MINNQKKILYFFIFLFLSVVLSFTLSYLISKKNNFLADCRLLLKSKEQVISYKDLKFQIDNQNNRYICVNVDGYVGNINIYFKNMIDKEFGLRIYNGDNNGNINLKGSIAIPQNYFYAKFTIDKPFSNLILQMSNPDIYKNINQITINESIFNKYFLIRFLLICIVVFFIFMHFIFDIKNMYKNIYEYRYCIGFAIVVFAIFFELNGSSISMWKYSTDQYMKESGIIAGKPRWIRVDEWRVYTPMQISQSVSGYKYFNDILRGTETDMFIFYAQPVKNIMSIFRPFLCGFLILDPAKGLAFYWTARIVSLFLVSLMFFMMITGNKKLLSGLGALMVTFAPAVQWWISPIGISEMLIFGQLAILMLYQYMNNNNFLKRFLFLFVIYICSGGYILVLYPAWQVPFAYVFGGAALWVILENRKKCSIKMKDFLSILFFILLLMISFLYIYNKSADTIYAIMNTVYPGKRFETGGGMITELFRSWGNIFFAVKDVLLNANVCESSSFIDLFPIGLILSLWIIFKEKVRDSFLILMSVCVFFIGFWCFFGLPKFLADISLMKTSPASRTLVVFGFANILLLIRALSLVKTSMSFKKTLFISFVLANIAVVSSISLYGMYLTPGMILIIVILSFVIFFSSLQIKLNKVFIAIIIVVVLFSGLFVNPIQSGIGGVDETQLAIAIREINFNKKGLWMMEGNNFYISNYIIMQGASTINSTNTYPNTALWRKFDKDGKYESIYNRYCHVRALISNNFMDDKFQLVQPDVIQINLQPDDLAVLNVDYIVTKNDLSKFNGKNILFKEIYSDAYYKIFEVERIFDTNAK